MKMKDLPRIDLPREKLEKYGLQKLRDEELLAVILGSGIQGTNVLQLSKKILAFIKKKNRQVVIADLLEIKGLGKAKATMVLSSIELGKRIVENRNPEILTPEDVWKLCSDFRDSKKEHFVAFYLDTQNRLIERQIISIGTLNANLVHPREVFEPALRLSAASVIVAHNHPSGITKPSIEDIDVTKRLVEAAEILGLELIDHVVLTEKDSLSFCQENFFEY